jgi:hypothetical protein
MAPGMRVESIGGNKWSIEVAQKAISAAEKSALPIDLVVNAGNDSRTMHLDYRRGLRYPHLTRDASREDGLTTLLAPRSFARPATSVEGK